VPQVNPRTLRAEFINPFVRLLRMPLGYQSQVYRYAEKSPPGCEGYQPRWEVISAALGAQQTIQVKVDLMNDFHILGILASATANTVGGFRAHVYDKAKNRRIGPGPQGCQFPNLGGNTASPFFLREPYRFDLEGSQALVILQNLEPAANTVQLVLFGLAAPFTGSDSKQL